MTEMNGMEKSGVHEAEVGEAGVGHVGTRATFETPKYPRRPRDQYTAQIVNTLELSAPPPNRSKKIFNLVISLVKFQTTNTYVAAKKNGRTVKQSLCKNSQVT